MADKKKIRVAVVGAGHVAQIAHIPAYRENPDVELVAVVDDDPVKARRIRKQFEIGEWYDDISEMLRRADVDAVDICTPNYLHAPMAIAALRAGCDVLCEKPLARSAAEASKMVDTADQQGKLLMVAMNNRFREDIGALQRFVRGGELGEVQLVKAGWLQRVLDWRDREWFTQIGMAGGGALLDLGTPLMDLAIWSSSLRKPTSVSCGIFGKKARGQVEDSAAAMVRFAGGACLMLEVSWNLRDPADRSYLQIYGTKGAAVINPLQLHKSVHGNLVNVTPKLSPGKNFYKESYRSEIDHFIECVRQRRTPLTSGKDAIGVMRILDAMYQSAASGQEAKILE